MRENYTADRSSNRSALSRSLAPYPLFRCREGLLTDLPDQEFSPARLDPRRTLSGTLAGGMVLPLDQTAPTHQGLLRHLRERSEDSSLGRPLGLRPSGNCQKATGARPQSVQNSPNSPWRYFRKTPDSRSLSEIDFGSPQIKSQDFGEEGGVDY